MGSLLPSGRFFLSFLLITYFASCKQHTSTEVVSLAEASVHSGSSQESAGQTSQPLTSSFKDYWYAGEAEITSYALQQARYGELREGTAMLIYVTEPFLEGKQVKAESASLNNIPVLKLNATRNFLTGIYPYSIMSSTFYPVANDQHATKITASIQEWCGHVYAQLNNREQFEITAHSYFQSEADQSFHLQKATLENELWTKLRIRPETLPVGDLEVIPSLDFLRLVHQPLKAYRASASLTAKGTQQIYTLTYPDLRRTLTIHFQTAFPHAIEEWTETYPSGSSSNAPLQTSRATKIARLKTAYWRKNGNEDVSLRDSLGI